MELSSTSDWFHITKGSTSRKNNCQKSDSPLSTFSESITVWFHKYVTLESRLCILFYQTFWSAKKSTLRQWAKFWQPFSRKTPPRLIIIFDSERNRCSANRGNTSINLSRKDATQAFQGVKRMYKSTTSLRKSRKRKLTILKKLSSWS